MGDLVAETSPRFRPQQAIRRSAWRALWAAALVSGCGRTEHEPPATNRMFVDVMADTGRTVTLRVEPPRASVWMAGVSEQKSAPSPVPAIDVPPPEPTPAPLPAELPPPPTLVIDPPLMPPVLTSSSPLRVPSGAPRGWIELDVFVDARGIVPEVSWAGGSRDPDLLRAAIECAQSMQFRPASRGGQPTAVWCRQRFDFESGH